MQAYQWRLLRHPEEMETTENRGDVADEDMLDLKEIKLSRFDREKRSQEK